MHKIIQEKKNGGGNLADKVFGFHLPENQFRNLVTVIGNDPYHSLDPSVRSQNVIHVFLAITLVQT